MPALDVLSVLGNIPEISMPKIFCGSPKTTPEDPDPSGKFVRYTTWQGSNPPLPVLDPVTGEPSFYYINYLLGIDHGVQEIIGTYICHDGLYELKARSYIGNPTYILFCDYAFTLNGGNSVPTTTRGRSADLSGYPATPLTKIQTDSEGNEVSVIVQDFGPNTLEYYLEDLSMTMMHELYHVYLKGMLNSSVDALIIYTNTSSTTTTQPFLLHDPEPLIGKGLTRLGTQE